MKDLKVLARQFFINFLLPLPRFEPGTFGLRIGGYTNRPIGQLIIMILHHVYRFKDKMAFSSDYFYSENNVCEMKVFTIFLADRFLAQLGWAQLGLAQLDPTQPRSIAKNRSLKQYPVKLPKTVPLNTTPFHCQKQFPQTIPR